MKKYLFLMLLIYLLLLSACTNVGTNGKTQSLEEFYKDSKIKNIDKIYLAP